MPYQIFNLSPLWDALTDAVPSQPAKKKGIVLLSGPPGAGKSTHLAPFLQNKLGGKRRTAILRPIDTVYTCARILGLPETHLEYAEFKRLPLARERLMAVSTRLRQAISPDFTLSMLHRTSEWKDSDFIIIDNAGMNSEVDYFVGMADTVALLELMLPFDVPPSNSRIRGVNTPNPKADPYFSAVNTGRRWPGDTRVPLGRYATSVALGPENVMVKLNSPAAIKDLSEIMSIKYASRPGKDASVAGTFNRLWHVANVAAAMRDLFGRSEESNESK